MHRSKWCNRKRSVGVTAHVIAPASKFSDCRSFSHLFFLTILPVKRTQETRNIHSSTLLSTSMATKGCGIFCISFSCPRSRSWTHRIVAGHTTTFHHFSGNWPPISMTQGCHLEIEAQFEPGTGGIEPPTFCLQAWVPTNYATFGWPAHPYKSVCCIATPARPPKSKLQNPKSKIQTGRLDFGFWSLEFGFWILDLGFWILDCRSIRFFLCQPQTRPFGFWILDFGFWILDFGFWILDFGSWILDFGFWISDFGFRILDFGFWILDFGFWILDFGFWILDFVFTERFGFCIRLLLLHADSGRRIIQVAARFVNAMLVESIMGNSSGRNSGTPFPILLPYHSHKNRLKYRNCMGNLWEGGLTIGVPWWNP